jgi:hypothetical protein
VVTAAHLGSMAASEVIGHFGPRPEMVLADLLAGVAGVAG